MKNKIFILSVFSLIFALFIGSTGSAAANVTPSAKASSPDFDVSKHEIVSEIQGELISEDTNVPCNCASDQITVKAVETGFTKNIYAPCKHGLSGNVYSKILVYVSTCTKCDAATAFTTKVTEVRCNH